MNQKFTMPFYKQNKTKIQSKTFLDLCPRRQEVKTSDHKFEHICTTVIPLKKCNTKLTTVAVTHKATRMQTECVHWDCCHFDGCNQILVESETRLLKESLAPRNAQNVSIFDTLKR